MYVYKEKEKKKVKKKKKFFGFTLDQDGINEVNLILILH